MQRNHHLSVFRLHIETGIARDILIVSDFTDGIAVRVLQGPADQILDGKAVVRIFIFIDAVRLGEYVLADQLFRVLKVLYPCQTGQRAVRAFS